MRVLVVGARGFVGRNLCEALRTIRDGKDQRECRKKILPLTIYEYDRDGTREELEFYCEQADFVFNLAGVNRPSDPHEFTEGNVDFARSLLTMLERCGNKCPVVLSSSSQASLEGRFADSEYGRSKLAGEGLFREYSVRTGAPVLIYRFPNLYGKWCRPNYNSAVATFCDAIANDRPYNVADSTVELELLYIDDLVDEMISALLGSPHRCGYNGLVPTEGDDFCYCPKTHTVSVGEVVSKLQAFHESRRNLSIPDLTDGSFSKKLWSTFQSYYEPGGFSYNLQTHVDARGSFTEFLRTSDRGQISVNVSRAGITKGNHWHSTKWEKFLVVSGEALVRQRRVGVDEHGASWPTHEFRVSGKRLEVIDMIPGYTHSITNLSDSDDLVTLIWANELFDPENPDTFFEEV